MYFVSLLLSQLCRHALEVSISCRRSPPSVAVTGFCPNCCCLPGRLLHPPCCLFLEFSFSAPCHRFKGVSPVSSEPLYWRMVLDSGLGNGACLRHQPSVTPRARKLCIPLFRPLTRVSTQKPQIHTSFGPSLWHAKSLCVLFVLVLWPSWQKPGLRLRHFSLHPDFACHSAGPRDHI